MCKRCLYNACERARKRRESIKAAGNNNHWYVSRKLAGLCPHCGGQPLVGLVLCEICREKEWQRSIRIKYEVIQKYGGKCACPGCSESNFMFLSLDHINGGGSAERKITKKTGTSFLKSLRKKPLDPRLQVLCYNCNLAKGNRKLCPHQYMDRVTNALNDVKSVSKRQRKHVFPALAK